MNWFSWVIQAAITLLAALMAFWFTRRHYRYQQHLAFIERQLQEFYSPLLGLLNQARLKAKLAGEILTAGNAEWGRRCEKASACANPELTLRILEEEGGSTIQKSIAYYNDQMRREVLSAYREMLALFRDKLWLAEPETSTYFPALMHFVELRERSLAGAVFPEVVASFREEEQPLWDFYAHAEQKHDELRKLLAGRKASARN